MNRDLWIFMDFLSSNDSPLAAASFRMGFQTETMSFSLPPPSLGVSCRPSCGGPWGKPHLTKQPHFAASKVMTNKWGN